MTTTTFRFHIPQTHTAPRLAVSIGEWAAGLLRALSKGKSAMRSRSRETAYVRALAHTFEESDPRFASELYAAADRHEALRG